MKYLVVNSGGIIENIIVADEDFAASIGAVPSYEGANIGDAYDPPKSEPDPVETEPVTWAALDAAYQEGVSTAYEQ